MSRSRPARLRRGLLAIALVLLALAAAVVWALYSPTAQRWARARVAAALGPSVQFTDLRLGVWPPPLAVSLAEVRLLAPDGSVAARARRVLARVRLRALLGRGPLLAAVRIEGADAELVRRADGALTIGTLTVERAPAAPAATPDALDAALPRIELRDSRLLLRDAADARRVVHLEQLAATLQPTRPGARLTLAGHSPQLGPVHGEATLAQLADWTTAAARASVELPAIAAESLTAWLPSGAAPFAAAGALQVTLTLDGSLAAGRSEAALLLDDGAARWGTLAEMTPPLAVKLDGAWGNGSPARLHGTVDAAGVRIGALTASAARADVALDAGGVTIRDGAWTALGARWRQDGTVHLGASRTVAGGVAADGVDAGALVALLHALGGDTFTPLRAAGALQVALHADGTLDDPLPVRVELAQSAGTITWGAVSAAAPLALSGTILVEDGTLSGVSDAALQAATISGADLTATAVEATFAYGNGALQIASLTAQAFDGTWSANGTLPLAPAGPPSGTVTATGIDAGLLAHALLSGSTQAPATDGDVDATATVTAGHGTLTLRLASDALTIGAFAIGAPASASAALVIDSGGARVDRGEVQLASARLDDITFSDVRAQIASAGSDTLRVAPLSARALGSAWSGELELSRALVAGTLRSPRVDFDRLLAAVDDGGSARHAAGPLQVTWRKPRQGPLSADVALQLASGTYQLDALTVSAPARGTATVHVDGSAWRVTDLVASAAAAAWPPLRGTTVNGRCAFDARALACSDLRFAAAGGQWQWAGTIGFDDAAPISGALTVNGATPAAVLGMIGVNPGALDIETLDLHAQVRGRLTAGWERDLTGSGRLALRGGTITSTGVLQAIFETLQPRRRARPLGSPNRLISVTEDFTISDGAMHTENLSLESDDYDLTARGALFLDGRLALDGRITLTQRGIQRLFALGSVPLPPRILSLPTIPARFEGTLVKPHIRPDPTALAGTTARWLAEALVGAPLRLGEALSRPLHDVFDGMRDFMRPGARATPAP